MTPKERRAARERVNLFLFAEGESQVSRAELCGYLVAALDQVDADEWLMRRAREAFGEVYDECEWYWDFAEETLAALRARLEPVQKESKT